MDCVFTIIEVLGDYKQFETGNAKWQQLKYSLRNYYL
jgi:hypothetical protein